MNVPSVASGIFAPMIAFDEPSLLYFPRRAPKTIFGLFKLSDYGFSDFAGSGIVHMAGAAAALAGVLVLGARRGKYNKDGSSPVKDTSTLVNGTANKPHNPTIPCTEIAPTGSSILNTLSSVEIENTTKIPPTLRLSNRTSQKYFALGIIKNI
jgi:hypothetical protein